MSVTLEIDAHGVYERFDAIGPNVHQALLDELAPLAAEIAADARATALAHIHTYGPDAGLYLSTIYGDVSDKKTHVVGFVRSASPLAHLLNEPKGVNLPARLIEASAKEVLKFEGDAGAVYRREVHFPGAHIPPYPDIFPAFEAARARIEAALQRVADRAGS